MSETAQGEQTAANNGSDREMLEESDAENRWTPAALKLAVNLFEEAAAAASDPSQNRYDRFDPESRWTPAALKLVMSGEEKG